MKSVFFLFALLCTPAFSQSTHWFGQTFHNPDGTPLAAGDSVSFTLPPDFPCRQINSWSMLINRVGTARIDVWRAAAWGFPNSSTYSITGGSSPWVDYLHKVSNPVSSSWKRGILPNDVFVFNIDYITGGANDATLVLGCQ